MTQTKSTSGEWSVDTYSTMLCVSADGKDPVCVIECDYREHLISPTLEQEANANLIAAAPDMYAMLKNVFDNYETDTHLDNQITVLLKKARGES